MAIKISFPEDLVEEIIIRMPVKSILRCKALSKHYCSLICSQCFILRHLRLGKLNNNKLFDRPFLSPILGSVTLFARGGHVKVLERTPCIVEGSSNVDGHYQIIQSICGPLDGLYCVIETNNISSRRCIAVWNPATREHFILPHPEHNDIFGYKTSPKRPINDLCIRAFGFGYDCNTNSYKVLVIYGLFSDTIEDMFMYIFNVNERTWIYHEEHLGASSWSLRTFVGVFLHGACHWKISFSQPSTHSIRRHPINKILVFNMSTESSGTILFPDVGDGYNWHHTSITTLNGCLALINANGGNIYRRFSSIFVWVMGEYGVTESWSIMYRVSIQHGIGGRYMGITGDRLYVHEGEGKGWLVSYDLDSKDVENYGIMDNSISSLLPYEESLVRIISSTRRSS